MNKKDYICANPFVNLEVHDKTSFLCCPAWVSKKLPKNISPLDAWNSKEANEIRDSILDGSYRYCDENLCSLLSGLRDKTAPKVIRPMVDRGKLPDTLQNTINDYKQGKPIYPNTVQYSFDYTCNLKCPTCRVEIITANKSTITKVQKTIEEIEESLGEYVQLLSLTGTGDPFVSVGFKNFLKNFDSSKYPNLYWIHLHTNATKWNKKMWNSMPNVHEYVKSTEVSIDAATQNTYENKVRLGGKWKDLISNLNYIYTIPTLKHIKTSFVVQNSNYHEMEDFIKLIVGICKEKSDIYFSRLINWGTFSEEEFKEHNIFDTSHRNHKDFVNTIKRILPQDKVHNNFSELL